MNLKDWFNKNTDEVQKAGLVLVHKQLELDSDETHYAHIGVKDQNGKRAGDFEVVVKRLEVTPMHHDEPIEVHSPDKPVDGAIESKDFYALVIDKDRDNVLQIILQAFSRIQAVGLPGSDPQDIVRMNEAVKSLSEDIKRKHHEKGWCTDPNCSYKSRHKMK